MATDAQDGGSRRDFLNIVGWTGLGIGTAAFVWPLVHQMNPAADVLALATTRLDLSGVQEGMTVVVQWQGKPVFVRHLTGEDIAAADAVDMSDLRDAETLQDRVTRSPWLVQIGICTHLGCVPLGNRSGEPRGDFDGWFCPCHGSHYDTAGRIRRGPAPRNLDVPPYEFVSDTEILIG